MKSATSTAVASQLRAFSGELNGIVLIHAGTAGVRELSFIAHAADDIAGHVASSGAMSSEAADSAQELAARVGALAADAGDSTYAQRLAVAANVLAAFLRQNHSLS